MELLHVVQQGMKKRKPFNREAMTEAFVSMARAKVQESGALQVARHFVHHQGDRDREFHSTTWFAIDTAYFDSSVMVNAIPGMVHQLQPPLLDKIHIVVAVATCGIAMASDVVRFMESERSRRLDQLRLIFLRHDPDEEKSYTVSNAVQELVAEWRVAHQGRSPNCLLLDDVAYSWITSEHCTQALRAMGLPVKAMLHLAATTAPKPKLLQNIPSGHLVTFDPGPVYKPGACPMCGAGKKKTIV